MVNEAKKIKAHKLLKNNEPTLNPMDYQKSLMDALNFYNVNNDNRQKKKWFQDHFKKEINFGLDIPDHNFKIAGTLCRIKDNGNTLDPRDELTLEKEFDKIKETSLKQKPVVEEVGEVKKVVGIQEKMEQKAIDFLGEFNGLIDEFIMTKTSPSVDKLINTMGIKGPTAKKVQARLAPIERQMAELKEAILGKDKELVAAYAHITKPNLKKLLGMYESLISGLSQAKVAVVRKERVVKAKPPVVIAKDVKFLAEFPELKLKSVAPALMIGAAEVWLYHTKYKKLMVYEAIVGQTLTVKGTTLMNFDVEKSIMKTVKKPETLTPLVAQGKRAFAKFFKETKAVVSKNNGRINKDCVIMAVFK